MKVLVAFGTTEGHTKIIARRIVSMVEKLGHSCVLHDCTDLQEPPDVAGFDTVFVAASVHQQKHQEQVAEFVKARVPALNAIPNAFISVSLSITVEDGQEEAKAYVTDFIAETGWTPRHIHMAAGAIRYLEYDYFKEFTIQQIVYKGKEKMPSKESGNPEFTDWDALSAFVSDVLD